MKTKPYTRISLLIPCEIDDTKKLMDALDQVRNKIRVSKTCRGYGGDGFAWTLSRAENPVPDDAIIPLGSTVKESLSIR